MRLYHISKTHRGGYVPLTKGGRGIYVGSRKYKIGGYSPLLLSKNLGGFGMLGSHTPETAKPIISNISKKLENLKVGNTSRKNVKFLL